MFETSSATSIVSETVLPSPLFSTSLSTFESLGQLNGLRLNALPPGESEQLARQRCSPLGSRLNGLQSPKRFFARDVLSDRVNASRNDHQQIVEVVGDAAGELTERIQFLRLGELPLHCSQFFLRFFPLGDVAGDLGKAYQLAGRRCGSDQ